MMSCIGSNSIIVLLLVNRKHNKIKYEQMFASQTNVYVQTHNNIESVTIATTTTTRKRKQLKHSRNNRMTK